MKVIQDSDEIQSITLSVRKIICYVTKENNSCIQEAIQSKKVTDTLSPVCSRCITPLRAAGRHLEFKTQNPPQYSFMLIPTPRQKDYRGWLRIKSHINIFHIEVFLYKTVIEKRFTFQCPSNQEIIILQNFSSK